MVIPTNYPAVMGVLNITPNSFYDGGKYFTFKTAIAQATAMAKEGATIIDIGGESTGPGSEDVNEEEELRRVIPIVEAISKQRSVDSNANSYLRISVDTYKSEVAKQALFVGADMINDITAGRFDPAMFSVVAKTGCPYIMMHSKDSSPRTTVNSTEYDDVLESVHTFFEERIAAAEAEGVQRSQIILDPGLGHFISSDPSYSWHILEHLESLQDFGCPILVSPSRKSFTAEHTNQLPSQRLEGTLKATQIALKHGANIIRTHDARETYEEITKMHLYK